MGRTACTEPQCLNKVAPYPSPPSSAMVKKEYSYTSTPPWTVRPVQSLSSCTRLHLTPHPLLVPFSRKGLDIPLLPLMGRTPCTEPQCLYKGAPYPSPPSSAFVKKVYSYTSTHPYGPYGLYRASVPVQRCTLPYFLQNVWCYIRGDASTSVVITVSYCLWDELTFVR